MNNTIQDNSVLTSEVFVKVYNSIESLETIRPAWERLQRHPNADLDFYLTILKVRPNILRPHVITLEREGQIVSMLIGRIEQTTIDLWFGYKHLLCPPVRALTLLYGGELGETSGQYAELLVDTLLASLRQGEADVATFSKLPVNSDLFRVARQRPGLLCRDFLVSPAPHWQIELPASLNELMQRFNSHRRKKINSKARVFERNFPGQINCRVFEKPEDVPTLCADLESVACLTYQRGLGVGFCNDEEHRERLALTASHGQLCALVIYVNKRPCAFELGTLYKDTFHLTHTSFDPALHQYEVGTLALTKMIDHLCRRGVQWFDFGFGDAYYKRVFATAGWDEGAIYIFAPRLRPMAINIMREFFEAARAGMQKVAGRLGLDQIVKRIWRKRLAQANARGPQAISPDR